MSYNLSSTIKFPKWFPLEQSIITYCLIFPFQSLSSYRNPGKGYENFDFAYNSENVAKFLQRCCFDGNSFQNFQGPDTAFLRFASYLYYLSPLFFFLYSVFFSEIF
ncbi:two-component response regulator-like APRR3 [Gossypium australe]|uniref:Two-component response regulator-like APRR3 n=1 Tax=Gossypium australe TaxID=47621 RepID=A0A5B6VDB1_9ROSI|nr:two-component response regulator-like APRR3 [Gossypium australe]